MTVMTHKRDDTLTLYDSIIVRHCFGGVYSKLSGRSANTTIGARLDVAASGLWGGRRERTLMDVRVFNPFALKS